MGRPAPPEWAIGDTCHACIWWWVFGKIADPEAGAIRVDYEDLVARCDASIWIHQHRAFRDRGAKNANNSQDDANAPREGCGCRGRMRGENSFDADVQEWRPRLPEKLYYGETLASVNCKLL